MDRGLLKGRRGESLASGDLVLKVILAASLGLNIYLLFFRLPALPPAPAAEPAEVAAAATPTTAGEAEPDLLPKAAPRPDAPAETRYARLSLKVKGSIAQTFGEALGSENGDLVSAFYSRIFMWRLNLKSDVRPGDELTLIYAVLPDGQVDIPAASYLSQKNRMTYRAYHFKGAGSRWPQFFDENGEEVAERLKDGPVDDYEQVTSLLKDRPTHKGIDFKTPVGTPVKSPYRGKITRVNWAHKYNGNCIEVEYDGGLIGKYLHLDKLRPGMAPGKVVAAGEVMADSGNTGHSTAPHLHYQLERAGDRIVDPFQHHDTYRLKLDASEQAAFTALMAALDAQLAGEAPATGAPEAAPAAPAAPAAAPQ